MEAKRVGQIYREQMVGRLKEGLDTQKNVFLVSYSEMSNSQINQMRMTLKSSGATVVVSKNNLAALALKELGHEKLADRVSGQTAFVWSDEDSVEVSKALVNFEKEFEQLVIKGGVLDGDILEQVDIKRLSELPSRDVLLGQLLGTIQAPITRLLGAFNAKSQDLLSILKQLSEKKGGS